MITVVFQPYAAKALLHIPVHLFHGKDVAMDEVEDVELSDLAKQVTDTSDNIVCIRLIEQFFLRRLYAFSEYNLKRMSGLSGNQSSTTDKYSSIVGGGLFE